MRDEMPAHLKFGYDHMLEMQGIEDRLRASGLTGTSLYFASVRAYEARHRNDPTYCHRQEAARLRGEKWVWMASEAVKSHADLLRTALEEIRDGHNNPRELAKEVLERINL